MKIYFLNSFYINLIANNSCMYVLFYFLLCQCCFWCEFEKALFFWAQLKVSIGYLFVTSVQQ